ncbi:M3 family metallopeptidase [Teichococcus cervicalis]|uniref:Peptidase family M3 n=1 Tax=Pseudoroseomonas cervicalis ATCC 49957 TaxID=525371 RepID=D5RG01_9PROT|nr:M3 family metallopeptidase [Pseudoroseomonas cervicalis]EFH13767.1 peptidase family M3 [Pseudoroseomonas cervicalis ATCC 49957]
MESDNPLLAPWDGAFGLPPFDRIRPEHFPPAFAAAMEEHRAEIAAIAQDLAPPGFANTVEALQRSGRALRRVSDLFGNLVVSLGGAALEALDRDWAPRLAQHRMAVALDPALFARIDALHRQRESLGLDPDQFRLLERLHLTRLRSGAALPEAGRARMAAITERLAGLYTRFGQNVLQDERSWCLPLPGAAVADLPDFLREGLAQAAASRGLAGHALTLSRSLLEPFLALCPDRALRRQAHAAWTARGYHAGAQDNRPLLPEILALRAERAKLLGYRDFAEFRLADSMAGSVAAAEALLREVWQPALRRAAEERDRLLARARQDGFDGPLEAWDWHYYAERVRQEDYALSEAALKPYLPLARMQQAAFDTASRLFGLRFVPRPDLPTYHPDVVIHEVRDEQGHVGLFLADPFARPDKRSGAWMSSYREQEAMDTPLSAIVVNNNNFARAEPALLSYDDATTLFHEFGHALHGLLSRVRYPAQSGTAVRRDFVELPSQIYEHWIGLPEMLRRYALHHQDGTPMPEAMIARLKESELFNQGFATVEYVSSALIDLALHRHPDPASLDIEAFEKTFLAEIGMPPKIGLRHRPAHFQHLFAGEGYAAGYYSYLWSEVLDADGFEAFEEAGDPFDPAVAARLKTLLSAGDSEDPMALYIAFRGRPPSSAALLRGRGLAG